MSATMACDHVGVTISGFKCKEDAYLLELVRYIHLNPIRAKILKDIKALDKYPFSGHSVIMGKVKNG